MGDLGLGGLIGGQGRGRGGMSGTGKGEGGRGGFRFCLRARARNGVVPAIGRNSLKTILMGLLDRTLTWSRYYIRIVGGVMPGGI